MKKIDEGRYNTDARITKLEESLNESRMYVNDAQSVSKCILPLVI